MDLPLNRGWARRAAFAASVALAVTISYCAAKAWLADHWRHSDQLRTVERGVALEPDNAMAWDHLGVLRQERFDETDATHATGDAISDFQHALRVDPGCSACWTDLAGDYEAEGQDSLAGQAYRRAEALYPASGAIAWQRGNFLLRTGRRQEGFEEIRRALRQDPRLLGLAISAVWLDTRDVNALIASVLPRDPSAYLLALGFFSKSEQTDAALTVWNRLAAMKTPVALQDVFPLMDLLIRQDRAADALSVWRKAAGDPRFAEAGSGSLIWNGNFSRDLANGGLGWRWSSPLGASLDFDAPPQGVRGRSLRLDFSGGVNMDLEQPMQYVAVAPSANYLFSAWMRTEEISTENGMLFAIADGNGTGAVSVTTENLTGSNAWKHVSAQMHTGHSTHFLTLRLYRPPSQFIQNELSGSAWIAGVSLIPD